MDEEAGAAAEACDWCGRPGRVMQWDGWQEGGVLGYRDPSLCPVCELLHDAESGDMGDAYSQHYPDLTQRVEEFERGLAAAWRAKVRAGLRPPQAPGEGPPGRFVSWTVSADLREPNPPAPTDD